MADAPDKMATADYNEAYEYASNDAFLNVVPATTERPQAIILAGQPGAGKTILRLQAKEELAHSGGSVIIDPDDLRRFHQTNSVLDYAAMARDDYRTAASRVQPDASDMADKLRSDAMSGRYNLVIDGTLKDPQKAEKLCEELHAAGYQIEVRALAVSDKVSRRSVAERLEKDLADPDATPRDVPAGVQDEAYQNMPLSVARIEHGRLADRVSVYARGIKEPLYSSDIRLLTEHDARDIILAERNREMTSVEKVEHAQKWDWIAKQAGDREAPAEEQGRYAGQRVEAHVQLRVDPAACAEYDTTATLEQTSESKGFYYASKASPEVGVEPADNRNHGPIKE